MRARGEKSLRIGVHHANAVVWEPVRRTRLDPPRDAAAIARTRGCASVFASRRCRRAVAPMRPGAPTTSISASHASGSFHTSECRGGVQRRQKRS